MPPYRRGPELWNFRLPRSKVDLAGSHQESTAVVLAIEQRSRDCSGWEAPSNQKYSQSRSGQYTRCAPHQVKARDIEGNSQGKNQRPPKESPDGDRN
jgi:hypothetical protein